MGSCFIGNEPKDKRRIIYVNGKQGSQKPPQEQARTLREVLNAAIDRLKPADAADSAPTADHYEVIHLKYRRGMETKQIADRLHVADATVFRRRKEAIDALVEDLRSREEALRDANGAATSA